MRPFTSLKTLFITIFKICVAFLVVMTLFKSFTKSPHNAELSLMLQQTLTCIEQLQQRPLEEIRRDNDTMVKCQTLVENAFKAGENKRTTDNLGSIDDCYKDLHLSAERNFPFKDQNVRKNFLESFRKCGYVPILMSKELLPIEDDNLPVPKSCTLYLVLQIKSRGISISTVFVTLQYQ